MSCYFDVIVYKLTLFYFIYIVTDNPEKIIVSMNPFPKKNLERSNTAARNNQLKQARSPSVRFIHIK